jgi:hypothetical protein
MSLGLDLTDEHLYQEASGPRRSSLAVVTRHRIVLLAVDRHRRAPPY